MTEKITYCVLLSYNLTVEHDKKTSAKIERNRFIGMWSFKDMVPAPWPGVINHWNYGPMNNEYLITSSIEVGVNWHGHHNQFMSYLICEGFSSWWCSTTSSFTEIHVGLWSCWNVKMKIQWCHTLVRTLYQIMAKLFNIRVQHVQSDVWIQSMNDATVFFFPG